MSRIECQVTMSPTDRQSSIVYKDGKIDFVGCDRQTEDQTRMKIAFADRRGNELATSIKGDGFPDIGLDFLWTYVHQNGDIKSVYLFEDHSDPAARKVKQRSNGDVVVTRFDEKEYTERDVVEMLCYAVAHSGITSKEMREKVEETIKWFKECK
jgi:hypothetical protein